MSDLALRQHLQAIRACPFGCGWEADRRILPGVFTTVESLLPVFIARCQMDIGVHLERVHKAQREPRLVLLRDGDPNGGAA